MPPTNRTRCIYDPPTQLSQGLVAGLSVAVVMMAGWFVVTVSHSATSPVKAGAAARPQTPLAPATGLAAAGAGDGLRQRPASAHFDWPAFASQPASSPQLMTLPLARELPPGGDVARAAWLPAPDSRDRGAPSAAAGETGAVAGVPVPAPATAGRDAPAASPPPRQALRKQKPRADGDAGQ
jgi:hypothetical protein